MTTHDPVNSPKHYQLVPGLQECWYYTQHMTFPLGNAFKYVFRYKDKNGKEDLNKAMWYLEKSAAGLPAVKCTYGLETVLNELEGVALTRKTLQLRVLYSLAKLDAYNGLHDWEKARAGIEALIDEA